MSVLPLLLLLLTLVARDRALVPSVVRLSGRSCMCAFTHLHLLPSLSMPVSLLPFFWQTVPRNRNRRLPRALKLFWGREQHRRASELMIMDWVVLCVCCTLLPPPPPSVYHGPCTTHSRRPHAHAGMLWQHSLYNSVVNHPQLPFILAVCGNTQVLYSTDDYVTDPVLAAVGQLQFEVIQFRMKVRQSEQSSSVLRRRAWLLYHFSLLQQRHLPHPLPCAAPTGRVRSGHHARASSLLTCTLGGGWLASNRGSGKAVQHGNVQGRIRAAGPAVPQCLLPSAGDC
jgi:hypothetical protein